MATFQHPPKNPTLNDPRNFKPGSQGFGRLPEHRFAVLGLIQSGLIGFGVDEGVEIALGNGF